jgi:hypothetical protein
VRWSPAPHRIMASTSKHHMPATQELLELHCNAHPTTLAKLLFDVLRVSVYCRSLNCVSATTRPALGGEHLGKLSRPELAGTCAP